LIRHGVSVELNGRKRNAKDKGITERGLETVKKCAKSVVAVVSGDFLQEIQEECGTRVECFAAYFKPLALKVMRIESENLKVYKSTQLYRQYFSALRIWK
jgi:hypothetical protein